MTSHLQRLQFVQRFLKRAVRSMMPYRSILPLVLDSWAWLVAIFIGTGLRLGFEVDQSIAPDLAKTVITAVVLQAVAGWLSGLYRGRWRIASFEEVMSLAVVWFVVSPLVFIANHVIFNRPAPTTGIVSASIIAFSGMIMFRMVWRYTYEITRMQDRSDRKRVLVYGAGEAGRAVVRSMLLEPASNFAPVAFIDDDKSRSRREMYGIRVVGDRHSLEIAARTYGATAVVLALPSVTGEVINELSELVAEAGLEVHVLPPVGELLGSEPSIRDVRPLTARDLLGREEVKIDRGAIRDYITGRVVLVTGAGGSIGSELCRQLATFEPSRLVMLDRDETALHGVQLSIEGRALLDTPDLVVADIRDRERIFEIMLEVRPDVVFHAAALKHLTLLENHPAEGYKTNVIGTKNVLEAANVADVDRVVNISTDKAANPSSILGSTKLVAEMVTSQIALRTDRRYVSVRFGNVLGSRGSVLPTFRSQIANGGPVTVTHPDVTRYFMTIPEAVLLVLQAGAIGAPASTLILDMGEPVRIADLARRLIAQLDPRVQIEFTGLRPGEKLDEELVARAEDAVATAHPRVVQVHQSWHRIDVEESPPAEAVRTVLADIIETAHQTSTS